MYLYICTYVHMDILWYMHTHTHTYIFIKFFVVSGFKLNLALARHTL
jgi:hypothetical protein